MVSMRVSNTDVAIRGYAPRDEQFLGREREFRDGTSHDVVRSVVVERAEQERKGRLDRSRDRLRIISFDGLHIELLSGETYGIEKQQVHVAVIIGRYSSSDVRIPSGGKSSGVPAVADWEPDGILRCARRYIELHVAVADAASAHVSGIAGGHLQLGVDKRVVVHIVTDSEVGTGKLRRSREAPLSDLGISHGIKPRRPRVRVS